MTNYVHHNGSVIISLLLMLVMSSVYSADKAGVPVVNPSRAFGYTLGDVIEQRVALTRNEITHSVPELPAVQREGRWVTRQNASVSADGQWLDMRYQIINAPPDTRTVTLPAVDLQTDADVSIEVPAWSFSIGPLLPETTAQDNPLPVMQPDWRPQAPATDSIVQRMILLAASLCLVLMLWAAWWLWRGFREAARLPFARAWHAQRRAKSDTHGDNAASWLALHRAFDQAAGRSISSGSIDTLVQSVEWLEPFRPELHSFYQQSSERFFAPDSQQGAFNLSDFSKRLYKAERRHTGSLAMPSDNAHELP